MSCAQELRAAPRHMPIANESLARKSARCRAIAQRQAALAGKLGVFEVGEPIGPHKFHSYVGGKPTALYVNLQCNCGAVFSYKRSNLSQLRSAKKNVQYCRSCQPKVSRKVAAA